ncbi:MAG: nucleoside triphosphate pyrophosphohydrolase [Clostridia bacterium]|nr:nucleoside triphosphate pyrophosphohydrolase [Clostridia bacterium]
MNREQKIAYLLEKEHYNIDDLNMIVGILRGEGGCPWDREQTHESIRNDLIEETYEVIEAIDTKNSELMQEELGDVLLQVTFHTDIEREAGRFEFGDVTDGICRKLIHRHPHVFGDVSVSSSAQVLSNWDKIKSEEKSRVTVTDKLRSIPPMLPALMRATKVGKKAACFDFADADAVMLKLDEETAELKAAISGESRERVAEELGDLLLTITSLARKLGVDSEEALRHATDKFIDRFEKVETEVLRQGMNMDALEMQELDKIWDKIKQNK